MSSCVEENFKGNFSKAEGEVSFRASVSKTPATKTLYGNLNEDGSKQEVFWTHNDQITVFGANCYIPQADYAVSVSSVDAEGNTVINKTQNYASALNKTGSYGVQWGNVAQTDFYAVYPATSGTFEADVTKVTEKTTEDGETVNVVTTSKATVTTNISTTQKVYFTQTVVGQNADGSNKLGWKGVHYSDDIHNPSANWALMYACTSAATTDKEQVDLQFHPFSTVLRFNFEGFRVVDPKNPNVPDYSASVYVEQIKLTAPTDAGVAGNFDLTINNNGTETSSPTAAATKGDSDVITIVPSDYIPLATHETLEFDVFTIPQNYTMSENALWTVTLETTGGDFTYEMIPKVVNNGVATSTTATLAAGKIHNLGIPMLTVEKSQAVEIPDDSWIAYIPRNVYLSELSMPGAWYSTNSDYQGESTLQSLYNIGVRAFNIDCRMTTTTDSWTKSSRTYSLNENPTYTLQCAGSETLEGSNVLGYTRVTDVAEGLSVESQLEKLAGYIEDDEFIIVVLTIAEQPKSLRGSLSGNVQTFGNNVNPNNILNALKDILSRKGKDFKIFGYRDIDKITDEGGNVTYKTVNANTTINDVLGSMLIKVNVNVNQTDETNTSQSITDLASFSMTNILLSEGSMASEERYTDEIIPLGKFTSMNEAPLYWGNSKILNPEMMYYYHQAQLTTSSTTAPSGTTTPSLYDRQLAIQNIIDKSYEIYKAEQHNALFQLGIGGYIDNIGEDRATVASTLNEYVLRQVKTKLTTEPSPIGMVLMNYAETTGADLCKAILEMNKKFFLNRNPEAEEWPNGNPFEQTANPSAQQLSVAHVTVTEEAF